MNRYGRISLVGLLGLVGLVVFVVVIFMGRESLTSVGARFMEALAKGDVSTLTDMTYLGDQTPDQIHKKWDFTVHTAGRYHNFTYEVIGSAQADANSGSVRLSVYRNPDEPGAYAENFQLPLVKVGDAWKVDVKGISRDMYPELPR